MKAADDDQPMSRIHPRVRLPFPFLQSDSKDKLGSQDARDPSSFTSLQQRHRPKLHTAISSVGQPGACLRRASAISCCHPCSTILLSLPKCSFIPVLVRARGTSELLQQDYATNVPSGALLRSGSNKVVAVVGSGRDKVVCNTCLVAVSTWLTTIMNIAAVGVTSCVGGCMRCDGRRPGGCVRACMHASVRARVLLSSPLPAGRVRSRAGKQVRSTDVP